MTNSIGIRRAERDDMAACAGILNRWIDATPWMPRVHDHADVERYYAETVFAERTVILAEEDGEIAGFLSLSDDHHVTALYIDKRHRGAGIGARLIATAKAMSPDELSLWTFEHNRDAQRFYEHQGFEAVRWTDGDNEEHLPDILYRWRGREVRV
ncbi:N-acetyltransferase family protein [Ensifer sp. 2YAB10]|jgi:GNAT superfamily N-acetyltransferase|uniref:GNAT family N-acetyltransferase n=1 Tax=unclassified Ensifer TaxID=2633371 RepID=UPI001A3A6F04|nr:GNAT family N-acetyltransferase [Ensifer sp. SSB1]MBK5568575.1 GNAT family N-acetyltransferase [Ensifer sp. SSB1]